MKLGLAALALLGATMLAGCDGKRREDFATCHMKSLETFGHMADETRAYTQGADYTMLCMETKGYEVDWPRCPTNAALTSSDRATDTTCYTKKRIWGLGSD